MIQGIADTNVLIELFRRNREMVAWFAVQGEMAITTTSCLEFMQGATSPEGQMRCEEIIDQFVLERLTYSDQDWAIDKLKRLRVSHRVGTNDCLIASVAYRLQIPVYTLNVKDFMPLLPKTLIVRPY
jgi:predicted nucleic acid-binding protein